MDERIYHTYSAMHDNNEEGSESQNENPRRDLLNQSFYIEIDSELSGENQFELEEESEVDNLLKIWGMYEELHALFKGKKF